jgi:hypothetical protein
MRHLGSGGGGTPKKRVIGASGCWAGSAYEQRHRVMA